MQVLEWLSFLYTCAMCNLVVSLLRNLFSVFANLTGMRIFSLKQKLPPPNFLTFIYFKPVFSPQFDHFQIIFFKTRFNFRLYVRYTFSSFFSGLGLHSDWVLACLSPRSWIPSLIPPKWGLETKTGLKSSSRHSFTFKYYIVKVFITLNPTLWKWLLWQVAPFCNFIFCAFINF